ncbi:hypothetical protein SETIT_8G160800v2 [Setaria italica]|uniref:Uncharacterized protein n=1 Tax=Setaria italica TaxID=4555 RepID=A0A368S8B9_SETIT|nr:hypothetical protein SETIT_8G160800v2 [Setaria italica]
MPSSYKHESSWNHNSRFSYDDVGVPFLPYYIFSRDPANSYQHEQPHCPSSLETRWMQLGPLFNYMPKRPSSNELPSAALSTWLIHEYMNLYRCH